MHPLNSSITKHLPDHTDHMGCRWRSQKQTYGDRLVRTESEPSVYCKLNLGNTLRYKNSQPKETDALTKETGDIDYIYTQTCTQESEDSWGEEHS